MRFYLHFIQFQALFQFVSPLKQYQNAIISENSIDGSSTWWRPQISQVNMNMKSIEGYTTKMSYSPADKVSFKINCSNAAASYNVYIYRLGYYNGKGARLVGTAHRKSESITQPNCKTESWSRMVDCSNWLVSAEWIIPGDAVSGLYVAAPAFESSISLRKNNSSKSFGNYIPFVVRQNQSVLKSDILFKTSDLTWVAYNLFGGWNIYRGGGEFSFASRAKKASYNRPYFNRLPEPHGKQQNFIFSSEFPLIYWLEKYGYDVTYASCSDVEDMHTHGLLTKAFYSLWDTTSIGPQL